MLTGYQANQWISGKKPKETRTATSSRKITTDAVKDTTNLMTFKSIEQAIAHC